MDDLPELPFEKVLSYLSLKDRLKARAVSRRWYHKINCFRPKCLCYSSGPSDIIWGKNRWVSGAFAENFIDSTRFASFFDTFGQTILSSLKHLRLCNLHLSEEDSMAFARILNSFVKLEELDIIWARLDQQHGVNLNLPMLTSLQLENVRGIWKLILKAPKLREVKILDRYGWSLSVEIVHGESVERLLVDGWECTNVKNLKNLKVFLYIGDRSIEGIYSTSLSSLQQLKEIHTNEPDVVSKLFEQKQRPGRADLKIYLCGLLLNGPDDPAINALDDPYYLDREWFVCLAENRSRLAAEIPFCRSLKYLEIEDAPGPEVDLLKRFTRLKGVTVYSPVEDVERFLNLLKNYKNIGDLDIRGDQRQDLFDRLPEHSIVQKLTLYREPSDLNFLFQLKHLIKLDVDWSIDSETVRRAFEELSALSYLVFRYGQKRASIDIDQVSKQFKVSLNYKRMIFSDLNAAIESIFG